jgi:PmbA protein
MITAGEQHVIDSRPVLEETIGRVLEHAKRLGATQAEAVVSVDLGLTATVRLGEVETIEYQRDRGLGITVYFGSRKGSASTADMSREAVDETVAKACSIARYTAEDDCAGLADPELMAREVPDLDLFHSWGLSPEVAIELATRCEAAALAVDPRIDNSEGASVSSHAGLHVYGNSHGFRGGYPTTSHSLSCSVLARDEGGMQRDYWYTAARDPAALEQPEAVGRRAGERTVARLGARRLGTCKVPVLFPAELARGLIGHLVAAIRGTSQYRKASFLLGAAGEQLFPEFVRIEERPHLLAAMASAPFDAEGVATADRTLVEAGVLSGYVLSSYSARKLALATTGNAGGVHNLVLQGGDGGLEELIVDMDRGLLVRELMGQGVNGVTGDYSRGAAGFWIEGGQIQYPVHEITIAGNLRDMYASVAAVGNDLDCRGGIRCGSLLLPHMTVAGE